MCHPPTPGSCSLCSWTGNNFEIHPGGFQGGHGDRAGCLGKDSRASSPCCCCTPLPGLCSSHRAPNRVEKLQFWLETSRSPIPHPPFVLTATRRQKAPAAAPGPFPSLFASWEHFLTCAFLTAAARLWAACPGTLLLCSGNPAAWRTSIS